MAAAAAAMSEQHDSFGGSRNYQRAFQLDPIRRDSDDSVDLILFYSSLIDHDRTRFLPSYLWQWPGCDDRGDFKSLVMPFSKVTWSSSSPVMLERDTPYMNAP